MISPKHVQFTLPNGDKKKFPAGTTGLGLAHSISHQLAKKVLAVQVNGQVWDAIRPIEQDAKVRLLTWQDTIAKQVFWHSTAHLLAEALETLYPNIQLGIGPPIAQGFYYDVNFGDISFDATHLAKVEAKMQVLAQQKNPYERIPISKKEAIAHYTKHYNRYKLELLADLSDGDITFYKQGNFVDLCKGPHLPHTGYIKAIKLLNIAGAYWRGNAENKQLTRIYGISFLTQKELVAHLTLLEEAKKRDHRKLGKELGFFTFSKQVGLGLPLWLPKGAFVRKQLIEFLRSAQTKAGYQSISTPHIGHKNLYITSGHYEKYSKDTFQPITTPHKEEEFLLKPMNCPHHCEVYKSSLRSYKDLPLRFAEFGTVYRYEQHGELHGLARTRSFTQDDAHIFCKPEQVKEELVAIIDLVLYVLKQFDFKDYTAQISLRDPTTPHKYMGSEVDWQTAETALKEATIATGLKIVVVEGEAAFYGPKIDFIVCDALGRQWQLGTVQLDYQLPERFGLTYIGKDNAKHRPIMIHRAPFGSLERFIAILLEHTAGNLPLWLSPEQVIVLPIAEKYTAYAQSVTKVLTEHEVRSSVDTRDKKIGRKIRDAETSKIPYMLIVGEKEVATQMVAVRKQGKGNQGVLFLEDFIKQMATELQVINK